MKYVILALLSFSLSGCLPDKEKTTVDIVVDQIESLIDQDKFKPEFIIAFELSVTEKGTIWGIRARNVPLIDEICFPPYKVIKYKNKFICLTSPMSQTVISKKELFETTNYPLDGFFNGYEEIWYIGVSADGKEHFAISADENELPYRFYTFPQLWKYIFEGFDEKNPPRFILGEYDLNIDKKYKEGDPVEKHIEMIRGMIYFVNSRDSSLLKDKDKGFFATLKGKDTLKYVVEDTLLHHFWVESIPNHAFFKELPTTDTWEYLYELLSDSTFYFQKERGKYTKEIVPLSMNFEIDVKGYLGHFIHSYYQKGVSERWINSLDSFTVWNEEFSPNTDSIK